LLEHAHDFLQIVALFLSDWIHFNGVDLLLCTQIRGTIRSTIRRYRDLQAILDLKSLTVNIAIFFMLMLMQDIGELRNLSILRLLEWSDITIGEVQFKSGLFTSLKVLHLYYGTCPKVESVKFDEEAMPKL
jgi:hypothetical protein